MDWRKLVPGTFVLVVLVAACAPTVEIRNERLLHDRGLLTGEPCSAPCWRGITVGETSWRDALTIITDTPEFEELEVREVEDSDQRQAFWQEIDGDICCIITSPDGDVIDTILVQTAPDFTMAALLDAQGDPSFVIGTDVSDDQAIMNLVYPDGPLVVYAFVEGAETGALSANSEIVGFLLMTPDNMDILLQTTNLHAWQGYQPYVVYTGDEEVAEFEITPSVTLTPTATND